MTPGYGPGLNLPSTDRQPVSLGDVPIVCLILAVLFALLPWFFGSGGIGRNELQTVSGVVARVYQTDSTDRLLICRRYATPCARNHLYVPGYLHVVVDANGSVTDFVQDGRLASRAPGLMELQSGDDVTVLVDRDRLWELRHGATTILSYEATRDFLGGGSESSALGFRLIALLLFVAAIVLRLRLGAWRGDSDEVPADA